MYEASISGHDVILAVVDALSNVATMYEKWLQTIIEENSDAQATMCNNIIKELNLRELIEQLRNANAGDSFNALADMIAKARRDKKASQLNDIHDDLSSMFDDFNKFNGERQFQVNFGNVANPIFNTTRECMSMFQLHKKMFGRLKGEERRHTGIKSALKQADG